jgi:hypothetical protein
MNTEGIRKIFTFPHRKSRATGEENFLEEFIVDVDVDIAYLRRQNEVPLSFCESIPFEVSIINCR